MTEAESLINAICNFNWSDAFAALDVDVKGALKMAASCLAAQDVISYDTTGMSKREAETRLDVLESKYGKAIAELKKIDTRKWMVSV